jgi:medium-chain acyl-[acyl-carrier-protein] hydrolase
VFCFPYAGGGASVFRSWRLPPDLTAEVVACQLPGRENRMAEPPLPRLTPVVDALLEAMRPLLATPFVFAGHSMGSLLAFELTRRLRHLGLPQPRHLFVSGHRAPDLPDKHPPVSGLADDEYLERIDRLAGPSKTLIRDRELALLLAPTVRADFALCETYRYREEAPLNLPITCVTAIDDPYVTLDESRAWTRHTRSAGRLVVTAGGHLFIRDRADEITALITDELRVVARPGEPVRSV